MCTIVNMNKTQTTTKTANELCVGDIVAVVSAPAYQLRVTDVDHINAKLTEIGLQDLDDDDNYWVRKIVRNTTCFYVHNDGGVVGGK